MRSKTVTYLLVAFRCNRSSTIDIPRSGNIQETVTPENIAKNRENLVD